MADLISPRLLARVERSLRKRLNTDVAPHLARYATQARSEDQFMAAASRLLLDAHERQEWLSGWVTAQHVDGGETAPAELDSTVPAVLDEPVQRSFHMSPEQGDRLRGALANELGPIADLLLENEMARSDSVAELLSRLEAHLDDDEQRTRFRNAVLARTLP